MKKENRFLQATYIQKIREASQHKRSANPLTPKRIFLRKIGLGNIFSWLLVVGLFSGLIYLSFFPNYFSVKKIVLHGGTATLRTQVTNDINGFLNRRRFSILRGDSYFWLDSDGLKKFLASADPELESTTSFVKHLPDSLDVYLVQRNISYEIMTNNGVWSAFSDGKINERLEAISSSTPDRLDVVIPRDVEFSVGIPFVDSTTLSSISHTKTAIEKRLKLSVYYLYLPPFQSDNLIPSTSIVSVLKDRIAPNESVWVVGNEQNPHFMLILNHLIDYNQVVAKLNNLLGETSQARFLQIRYIDMRLEERGYICLIESPCSKF